MNWIDLLTTPEGLRIMASANQTLESASKAIAKHAIQIFACNPEIAPAVAYDRATRFYLYTVSIAGELGEMIVNSEARK